MAKLHYTKVGRLVERPTSCTHNLDVSKCWTLALPEPKKLANKLAQWSLSANKLCNKLPTFSYSGGWPLLIMSSIRRSISLIKCPRWIYDITKLTGLPVIINVFSRKTLRQRYLLFRKFARHVDLVALNASYTR
jgi:hypothetical protein